jgi:hypothetical protein
VITHFKQPNCFPYPNENHQSEIQSLTSFVVFLHFLGIGAMYVRRRPRVRVEAPQSGGGQERGMRSGTLPTPLCVGLGAACELAMQEMEVCIYTVCQKKIIYIF